MSMRYNLQKNASGRANSLPASPKNLEGSKSMSWENQCHPETLDVEFGHVMREAEKCLTPNDHIRINKWITALKK